MYDPEKIKLNGHHESLLDELHYAMNQNNIAHFLNLPHLYDIKVGPYIIIIGFSGYFD